MDTLFYIFIITDQLYNTTQENCSSKVTRPIGCLSRPIPKFSFILKDIYLNYKSENDLKLNLKVN